MTHQKITVFDQQARGAFEFAAEQLRRLITNHPDYFPLFTQGGKWLHQAEAWTNWCEGFLGGMLWIMFRRTEDNWWRDRAEHYSGLIEHRKHDRNVHDLGFLFLPTWKVWYDLTNDPAKNAVVIDAGRTLALRFQEKGRYLCSFVAAESLFIDIMMNVGIIFYAAQQTGDERLFRIASDHCLTTRRFLVRGDGSTAQEGIFDLDSGEFLRQSTHQGRRSDSTWARGLTWALFGFTTAYSFSGDARFLDTAERCADYLIAHTPSHGVPANDLEQPGAGSLGYTNGGNPAILPGSGADKAAPSIAAAYESSAAAIAARGFLELAKYTQATDKHDRYLERAYTTLGTLLTPEFLAIETPGWEGILKHGIYHEAKGLGVDESVMWGDYFFLSALNEAIRNESA
jgi:unsaturated chondroitin disaccharide hydrolase